ncbi:MBL fold metallo-hydrolase [Saccharospirillum salsuginis]|uniref:MBL fold metallo-hydrolase n=1 Tax=Saccharospirillum salsuginis TaxID=418750 RepID=A0A918N956_9GAMM|nr:MBL fold metallo-hydrolase [Saccharospirillum salsuginis]GGX49472.1 MBL fold metallo-hydrolase [Saccharospirillum salsuginis]
MKVRSVLGNSQKLDGGAMFGNAPKALWQRWYPCDDLNRIELNCRCLLVEEDDRTILFETGVGAFFPPDKKDRFGVQESDHRLMANLADLGVSPEDIDIIVLSHLHFDHAGGLLSVWEEGKEPELVFPNARYVVGEQAWQRALKPHPRDRASFIPELPGLLEATGRVERVQGTRSRTLGDQYRFHHSDGHTPGMLLTEITLPDGPLVFAADLIPGTAWVHVPITMGYDRYPEALIDEKHRLLSDLASRNGRLFFTHDPNIAVGRVVKNDKGKFTLEDEQEELAA